MEFTNKDIRVISNENDVQMLNNLRKNFKQDSCLVAFVDSVCDDVLVIQQFRHPVDALRSVPSFCKEVNLSAKDIKILYFAEINHNTLDVNVFDDFVYELKLSCYYKLDNSEKNEDSLDSSETPLN